MTRFAPLIALLLAPILSAAESVINFQAALAGAHAAPPNQSAYLGVADFELRPNALFLGFVEIRDIPPRPDVFSVAVFSATSPTLVGTRLFDVPFYGYVLPAPDEGGARLAQYAFTQPLSLTAAEAADLQSGNWWVTLITPDFPNGEIRGQITVVPEPSTYALLACGIIMLVLRKRKTLRRRQSQ